MYEIIKSPCGDRIMELVSAANNSIKICSPFIKYESVSDVFKRKKSDVHVDLITRIALSYFHHKSSDIGAVEHIIINNGIVKNYQHLHAKIYIFDDKATIVTSANLTTSGLYRNYEYGIYSDQDNLVKEVCKDYESLYNNELTGTINILNVNEIKQILNNIPKEKTIQYPNINLSADSISTSEDEIFNAGKEFIEKTLNGWKLAVYKCLNLIENREFVLEDIYKYKYELERLFPNNRNIEAKIRQQLQLLRDIGLIKFLGNGKYIKLWK